MPQAQKPDRRTAQKWMGAGLASATLFPHRVFSDTPASMLKKPVLSSGEKLPVVGIRPLRTFNVGQDRQLRLDRTEAI
jgi:hypothetical protein